MRASKEGVFVLCLVLITMAEAVIDIKALDSVSDGINLFASSLYEPVADGSSDNLAISPLNAAVILAMAAYGSGGDTKNQFKNVLHLPTPDSVGLSGYQALIEDLNDLQSNKFSLSNKIFIEKQLSVKPHFETLTQDYFRSLIEKVNLAESNEAAKYINDWIKSSTKNRIQQLVSPADFNGCTGLVLVSTIYFKSYWKHKFNSENTRQMLFHVNGGPTKRAVPTMTVEGRYLHGDLPDGTASFIVLPYQNNELSMLIILPKKIDGLPQIEQELHRADIADILNQGCDRKVRVYLPKFKIRSTVDLKDSLTSLGLADMFTTNANFEGIADARIIASKVVQSVHIEVDEEGSEGGTAIDDVVLRSHQSVTQNFTIDHPFYYSIMKIRLDPDTDDFSALTILSGHVTNPQL